MVPKSIFLILAKILLKQENQQFCCKIELSQIFIMHLKILLKVNFIVSVDGNPHLFDFRQNAHFSFY